MAQIHSVGSLKISPRLGTTNIKGAHEETKTRHQRYQREHQDSIKTIWYQQRYAPANHNRKIKSYLRLPCKPDSKKRNNLCWLHRKNPIQSRYSNTEIFVLYNWSSNDILETLVKDLIETSTIATFKEKIPYKTKNRLQTSLQHHRQRII